VGYWKIPTYGEGEENEWGDLVGEPKVWGDAPADIIDAAIQDIQRVFRETQGRPATKAELMAGFEFSWRVLTDDGLVRGDDD